MAGEKTTKRQGKRPGTEVAADLVTDPSPAGPVRPGPAEPHDFAAGSAVPDSEKKPGFRKPAGARSRMHAVQRRLDDPRTGDALSRRERQIMDLLYRLGEASAHEIRRELPKAPGYSAVRALLAVMIEKNLITHRKESRHYLYRPAVPEKKAKRSALRRLLGTFFDDSPEKLVASLLDPDDPQLSAEEIERIRKLIDARPS